VKSGDLFGVDIKKGLALVANNKTLYLKLLKSFSSNTIFDELEAAVAQGDLEQARAKAHALKGVSGNLRLEQVYELSRAVEADAKESRPPDGPGGKYAELQGAYHKTMDSVNTLLANPELLNTLE
jgi:HPt (histidine-containing phosphotransfer) domain-containing protein